ncbi:hypothetical protein GCM10023196_035370 [Actinoallomurus vinaceus]|uniref:Aminoglycoside phosphotransferase n=1 Tax=Actinoallomurus vinaceus TaxID=1080074 RepID=A0ABP8U8S1_9ACTN
MTGEQAEEEPQRAFLRRVLAEAADRLGARLAGEAVFGWRDRTIGAPALKEGEPVWLRATAEHRDWTTSEEWTGNQDAAHLTGIPKPSLLDRIEWDEAEVMIYAELMTFVPDRPCSPTPELRQPLDLPRSWWKSLRGALDALAGQTTRRGAENPGWYEPTLRVFFGARADHLRPAWSTEHMDMHWANVTSPRLWVLDWEHWGRAPAGYGAASLYCHSLLVPDMARQVRDTFADVLEPPEGRYAQLCVIGHMLRRIDRGDYLDLAVPLHEHADRILDA